MPSVGVAFITHNAERHLRRSLPPVIESSLRPKVLVVNSSSEDRTVEVAQRLGAETLLVPRRAFNHGATREAARRRLGTDIVAMMTPDAYALDSSFLERLVEPLMDGRAAVSYARQIPHDGADLFEAFGREYNYPKESHLRGREDLDRWGVYLYFNSNACAAYLNRALDSVGGFPKVLSLEDTIVAGRLLQLGYRIAYTAEAVVKHSHRYTLAEEFRRHFDTGYVRAIYRDTLEGASDERRGLGYATALLKRTAARRVWAIPYAIALLAAKWAGYRLGAVAHTWPVGWKRRFSGQDYYWTSDHYEAGLVPSVRAKGIAP
jgi:rhamnosyltransferase